jgi:hypothetical protein
MNKLDIKVKNLGRFKGGTVKVRPLTVLTGLNIISSVNIKQIFINNTKNGIQCFGKKTFTRAIFTCQYS